MHPTLFEIPGTHWPIRSFGVMVVIGFLLGARVLTRIGARYAVDPEQEEAGFAAIPVWALIGVLVGARMMYVVVEVLQGSVVGQEYLENPFKVFAYWEGGLVMYGGLLGGVASGVWCAKRHGLRVLHALDIAFVGAFVGLAAGRLGCLLVGDDYGRIVPENLRHLPFPVTIRVPEILPERSLFGADNAGQVLYATQIWMSANAILLALFGHWLLKRRRYAGQVTLWSLLLYAITRSTIEMFRGDRIRGLWFGDRISTSQVISIAIGLLCLFLLLRCRGRREPTPVPANSPT